MKKLFIVLFLVSFAAIVNAQWIVTDFETAAADSFFRHAPQTGLASGEGTMTVSDVSDPVYHGNGAYRTDWEIHSSESYGGYIQFNYNVPQDNPGAYLDWSSAEKLRIWYNVITPSSQPGLVKFRMQIYDPGADYWNGGTDHESWYFEETASPYVFDNTPGWHSLDIPLVDRGKGSPNAEGFALTGWAGVENNAVLDLDKVVGYVFEWTTPGIPNNGKANGSIVWDKLEFVGNKYPPVYTFDDAAATSFFSVDDMGWAGDAGKGALTLTDVTDTPFEGTGSLKLDVKVNNSQGWGGYVNAQHNMPDGTFLPDLGSNAALYLYVKLLQPFNGAKDRVTMRFFLYDKSSTATEPWQITVPVDLYTANDQWQQIKIPLVSLGVGLPTLSKEGFTVPSWESANYGDGNLNLDKIASWKIEFSGSADAPYVQGEVCEGSLMVDLLTPGGYRETDVTGPNPPEGLLAVAGTYSNLVTWTDVPGETGEKYNVYFSLNPITDVTAPGVDVVQINVPENTQLVDHVLRAPVTDQEVKYYYAVNAVDKAGNIGAAASTDVITNTAQGVPVIQINNVPANFTADGNLEEWQNIPKLRLSIDPSHKTAYVVTNSQIDGDADLMCDVYLAADATYLYAAFDIEDDVVVPSAASDSWQNDCPDLFIGLYDWHGAPHGSYHRGAQPDYHVRFAYNRVLFDGISGADHVLDLGESYFWGEKFPTGYSIEAKIPWTSFASFGNDSLFVPQKGMRIPIDFEINDNDDAAGLRTGQMDYSPLAEGNSYSSTARWTYTWMGDQWTVGVNDKEVTALNYQLNQNYPNPFNPTTKITYSIEKAGNVTVKVFDMLGREIAVLVNKDQNAGVYTIDFNAAGLASGMYLYQINAGEFQSVKKMMLIK